MTTDEQLTAIVDSWLESTNASPHTAEETVDHVAARLPQTRQRSRWWRLPSLRRTTTHLTDKPRTDSHAISVQVANGHSPTVTGRTQSMFSPAKAITAGALVFALGGVLLIAQPFDQQGESVPGAATDAEGMTPALVTGSLVIDITSGDFTNRGRSPDRIGLRYELTGEAARAEMSDPRLDGSVTVDWMQDQHWAAEYPDLEGLDVYFIRNPGRAVIKWGTVRIENDAGAWEGTLLETFDVTDDVLAGGGLNIGVVELVGADAYDGLSAVLFMRDGNPEMTDETEDTDYTVSWNGIIFPGNLPPDR